MPLPQLLPGQNPAPFDVQETALAYDVLGRYTCNLLQEVIDAQNAGGYPFDAVVIGAGMFGGYIAEKLYRLGESQALRILVLDAGAFLFPSHIQNLPQRLGGKIGGPDTNRAQDDGRAQNVIWGMPWSSNEAFPGLAYCLGGRSLFWGGWSPRLQPADLANWPAPVAAYLTGSGGARAAYLDTEEEIGVQPSTDYIVQSNLYTALQNAFTAVMPTIPAITEVAEAPLAVQGSSPGSGVFPFDKFSSGPFLLDAIRADATLSNMPGLGRGDVSRRIFVVPRTQVLRLNMAAGGAVTSLDLSVNGQIINGFPISPTCAVILANGTIEATRLALESLGVGSGAPGAPRVGNLMAHLRSNITVRIQRNILLATPPGHLETTAHIVRGTALGRRFHIQVTAADVAGPDPEIHMWSMVPDIDVLDDLIATQDPQWVSITLRCIGEMEDQRVLNPAGDPVRSWIDLSPYETDRWGKRRAYAHLVATANDQQRWDAMDNAAFALALAMARNPANIQYWNKQTGNWQNAPLAPDAQGNKFWRDGLGTTHHEAGTLFMGNPGTSVTDLDGKFHSVSNVYVAGPALFPTLGSANPSLTALSLARRTARAIVAAATPTPAGGMFTPLSLDPADWQMVTRPGSASGTTVRRYGLPTDPLQVLETLAAFPDGYGLYWYTREQFANFVLRLEWRVARRDDNSGVYIRIPAPGVANPLDAADTQGHEIQIDERGYDSVTNTEGHPEKRTGAIYNLQAPSAFPSNPIGQWNTFLIEANGPRISVTLNNQPIIVNYMSQRQPAGFIALQAHHATSRVQFRNLQIQRL